MSFETWVDGAKAEKVKDVIDTNFKILYSDRQKNIKALTTKERLSLSSGQVSEGLVVFDKDDENWYEYENGEWVIKELKSSRSKFTKTFEASEWSSDGVIYIPYDVHATSSPTVELFISIGTGFELVYGGVSVDEAFNITLSSDIAFNGKVVIQ